MFPEAGRSRMQQNTKHHIDAVIGYIIQSLFVASMLLKLGFVNNLLLVSLLIKTL